MATDGASDKPPGQTESNGGLASNEVGYHVYRADVNGSEAVAAVEDGTDQEMIEAVTRDCQYVTSIRFTDAVTD